MAQRDTLRLAAVADLHCTRHAPGPLQSLLTSLAEQADVVLLCGDLVDYGLPEEARLLGKALQEAADDAEEPSE